MIGPGGLLLELSSLPPICCPNCSFMGGVAKEYITKLGCEFFFVGSHIEQHWRRSYLNTKRIINQDPQHDQKLVYQILWWPW